MFKVEAPEKFFGERRVRENIVIVIVFERVKSVILNLCGHYILNSTDVEKISKQVHLHPHTGTYQRTKQTGNSHMYFMSSFSSLAPMSLLSKCARTGVFMNYELFS